MQDGFGNGSFFLPVSAKSNNYRLRAYTSWMKNFGPEYFFEKIITVANPFVIPDIPDKNNANAVADIQFFPEGGDLVQSLRSRIAFKVVNGTGEGVDGKGFLMDEQDTIARFETEKFGMGSFTLIPDENASYSVNFLTGDSTYSFTRFPLVKQQGYVMKLKDNGDALQVNVTTSYKNSDYIYLIGHTNQVVKVVEGKVMEGGKAVFEIAKSALADGISHLTVFDHNIRPVEERLYFKQPKNIFDIHLATNKASYSKRERVKVSISTRMPSGINPANLSVSVFLCDSLQTYNDPDIISYLLLTSELKGKIESPGYYFNKGNEDAADLVDNLMLTNGWRRFNWEDVITVQNRGFEYIPEWEGHLLNVQMKSPDGIISGVKSFLSVPGKTGHLYTSKSDHNGIIRFVTNDIHGVRRIILQPHEAGSRIFNFDLVDPFYRSGLNTSIPALQLKKKWQESLRKRSIYMQSQNIYSGDKKNIIARKKYLDSIPFYGTPGKRYILDNYTRFPTMEEVMKEYVMEVMVRKRGKKYNFKVLNKQMDTYFEADPLVVLDGTPVRDINSIMAYDPLNVKTLDIITGVYMLGNDIWVNGILSYSSYNGNRDGMELDPAQVQIDFKGLQLQREFYKPQYDNGKGDEHLPDFRNVLLWEPYVITDKAGNVSLDFYSSDVKGKFIIVAEGITGDGSPGFETGEFVVE